MTATGAILRAKVRQACRGNFRLVSGGTRQSLSPAGPSALNSIEQDPFFERRHRGSEHCRHENKVASWRRSAGWALAEFQVSARPMDGIFHVARKDCRRYLRPGDRKHIPEF